MLISEFVKKYSQSKQKSSFIEKQIKTKYIPYETKISSAQRIVDISMYKEIDGKKIFVLNTPIRYMLFVQAVIDMYTNLEWDKNEDTLDITRDFNLLEENGLVENIIAAIGDDVTKFTTVLNMVVDDETDLNRSIVPFIETKIEAFDKVLEVFSQVLETPEIEDKIIKYIGKK